MNGTTKPSAGKRQMLVSYGMYVLSMLIFGTNGYLVAHMSLQSGQIVLLRTLLGGFLLTVLVLLRGGFDGRPFGRNASSCCSAERRLA